MVSFPSLVRLSLKRLAVEVGRPAEVVPLSPAFGAGLQRVLRLVSAAVLLQLPGVGEAQVAAVAGVQLDARVDLHVGLELVGLPEPPAAHAALVRLLSGVHQQVAVVVLRRPELFAAMLTAVRLHPGVQQLVLPQLRRLQEAFAAEGTDVRPVAGVLPLVVLQHVPQVEGLPAGVAGELLGLLVALLVHPERAAAAETLQAHFAAERFDSGGPAARGAGQPALQVAVDQLLVFLQLTVVEKGFSTAVTHEGLLHTVNQHVGFQSPGS